MRLFIYLLLPSCHLPFASTIHPPLMSLGSGYFALRRSLTGYLYHYPLPAPQITVTSDPGLTIPVYHSWPSLTLFNEFSSSFFADLATYIRCLSLVICPPAYCVPDSYPLYFASLSDQLTSDLYLSSYPLPLCLARHLFGHPFISVFYFTLLLPPQYPYIHCTDHQFSHLHPTTLLHAVLPTSPSTSSSGRGDKTNATQARGIACSRHY